MEITKELAQQVREKAKTILDREIIITNSSGIVLVGPTKQVGKFVAEALTACQEGTKNTGHLGPSQVEWLPFVYEQRVIGVFGIVLDEGMFASETFSLLQGLAEVIVHQFLLLDKMQSPEIGRAEFIKELLTASQVDFDDAYHQADILQLNLRANQAVILANIHQFEHKVTESKSHLSPEEQRVELRKSIDATLITLRTAFKNNSENVVSYLGDDTFVILKGIGGGSLNTLNTIRFLSEKGNYIYEVLSKLPQNNSVTVGIGQYYPNLGGLRKSYQDAKLSLSVGSKVWGRGKVYHVKQVGMFVTLANIGQDRKAELAHQILHPLLRDQQLYKTVKIFLDSGLNLTEASKNLHIHRNTLIYRLDKTKKIIGLDPRHFDDALQIKLGLMFYQPA
ncbi:MAG: helix-turn-helix domain-containing protein [Candidatus Saccharimonadia bacterium]